MSHIFISYSKKDRIYARRLADKLLAEGFSVWIDDRIDYGDDWWHTIVEAIKGCAAFVVIMSKNSDESRWVQREVTIADELQKPTFPLLLDGNLIDSKNWSIYVRTQYKDVRHGSLPDADFYDDLTRFASRSQERGQELAPAHPPPPGTVAKRARIMIAAGGLLLAIVVAGIWLLSERPNNPETVSTQTERSELPTVTTTRTPTATSSPSPEPTTSTPATPAEFYAMPLKTAYTITSEFSSRNPGINLRAEIGDAVYATADGSVVVDVNSCSKCTDTAPNFAAHGLSMSNPSALSDPSWGYGWGKFVRIRYANNQLPAGMQSVLAENEAADSDVICLYGHLSSFNVAPEQTLLADEEIGAVGNTGNIQIPSLRIECRLVSPTAQNWVNGIMFDPLSLFGV